MFSTPSGAAKLSLVVVIGLITLKVVVAVILGSISVLAQAVDSLLDLVAILITGLAVSFASRPADKEHPFGHGKAENIAATVQAVLILMAGGLIIYAAVQRITGEVTVELTEAGIGVMLVSIVASIFLSRHLIKVARATDSIALEANARNIATDVYSATAVLAGLVAIRFTGLNILDPIIALGVALVILKAAYDVMRKSFGGLVDVRLPQAEEDEIRSSVTQHGCLVGGFHDLRTRKAGSQRYIDLHLVMPKTTSVEEAHRISDDLEQDIKNRLPHASVTIHIEPGDIECEQCTVSCTVRDKTD